MKRLTVAVVAAMLAASVSVALAASGLSGKYKTVIHNNHLLHGGLNGTWVLKLSHGDYHMTLNGEPAVHGTFTINKNVISLKDSPGPGSCPTTGKYKFKVAGDSLKFTLVSDSTSSNCIGRVDVLKHTFTKVK
jgi:hypothetical protein